MSDASQSATLEMSTKLRVITLSFIRAYSSVQSSQKVISTSKIALRKGRRCSYHIIVSATLSAEWWWWNDKVKLILVVLFRCITNINQNNRANESQTNYTAF